MNLLIISDTHLKSANSLPGKVISGIKEADLVIHCGDYTSPDILHSLQKMSTRFIGVHGNTDPPAIREELPGKLVLEIEGRKIGLIHPHWGGAPFNIEEELMETFGQIDVILFGHTHEPLNKLRSGTLFLNPGQCYSSFLTPATMATLTITADAVVPRIVLIGEK